MLQVIDNQICFRNTEYNSIVQLFNSRAQMHNEVNPTLHSLDV